MMQTQTKTKETVTKAKCWNVYTCIYDVNSDKKQRKRKELKPNAENFTFIWRKLRQKQRGERNWSWMLKILFIYDVNSDKNIWGERNRSWMTLCVLLRNACQFASGAAFRLHLCIRPPYTHLLNICPRPVWRLLIQHIAVYFVPRCKSFNNNFTTGESRTLDSPVWV